jgi:hypothetical protein
VGTKNWEDKAFSAVVDAAHIYDSFTTDEVWQMLEVWGEKAPADSRRMGSIIKRAQAENIIRGTFAFRRSHRSINHGRPVRLWKSCL